MIQTANWIIFSEAELNIFIKKFNEEDEQERNELWKGELWECAMTFCMTSCVKYSHVMHKMATPSQMNFGC